MSELSAKQQEIISSAQSREGSLSERQMEIISKARGRDKKELLEPTVGEFSKGVGETGMTLVSGIVAQIAGGWAGIGGRMYDLIRGEPEELQDTVNRINRVAEKYTYEAKSPAGKAITEGVAKPFQTFEEDISRAGEHATGVTGSPAVGAGIHTLASFVPASLGGRGFTNLARKEPKPTFMERHRDVKRAEDFAKSEEIDLSATEARQAEQFAKGAQKKTAGMTKGVSLPAIKETIIQARDAAKQGVDALYDAARDAGGAVKIDQVRVFKKMADDSLKTYLVEDMPKVKLLLSEVDDIAKMESGAVKLQAMENWRKKINRNRPPKADESQNAAMTVLKAQYDEWLEGQFNADMIKGTPEAIEKWKKARSAHQRYREKFKDDKVIRQLAEKEATPEEMRKWIFGASATGAKKESAAIVKRIKDIVGKDSVEFLALRNDALLDVMGPLLKETPNLGQFVANYDKLRLGNNSLLKELFPQDQLRELRNLANAVRGRKDTGIPDDWGVIIDRAGGVLSVGHQMAQRAALRLGVSNIIKALRMPGNKRQTLGALMGYDPQLPTLNKMPVTIEGTIQTLEDQDG